MDRYVPILFITSCVWSLQLPAGSAETSHWAFVAPVFPSLPEVARPDWCRNEIDPFVLAKLELAGITPSPVATRETLIRRVWFDLCELPPTLMEIDRFLGDDHPDAYERMVDRALASPHFGENMARIWLDLARYGDTNGYQDDSTREVWLWRDWVIGAYNENMPFDQFTIEQLAGDLIPDATVQQRVASGFNRNTRFNEEGGSDPAEWRIQYAKDRTNTLGQVWLGISLACAECHDHKYDPISQKEYYQLFAFFNSLDEPGAQGHNKKYKPIVRVPTADQHQQVEALQKEIAALERQGAEGGEGTRTGVVSSQERLQAVRKSLEDLQESVPYQLVSVELREARPAHLLVGGDFLQPADEVYRDVPAVFPPLGEDRPCDRLGLARWLVSRQHPLTARVTVNRYWAQLFGQGLVPTLADFGKTGVEPTHPKLLDWLAYRFIQSGWNTKQLLRLLVCSATYRQSSRNENRHDDIDAHNKLIWRAPRFRLSAEGIRDMALCVSGLIDRSLGGPSVFPYQPPDYYKDKKESWKWVESQRGNRYRRSLYTFWRRTTPYPSFLIFDAPDRCECTVERARTNTPLQALVTMNEPQFMAAARAFATHILRVDPEPDARIEFAFRTALSRAPTWEEVQIVRQLAASEWAHYDANHQAADQLVGISDPSATNQANVVEHAVWTAVANAILNLDETITRQ